MSTSWQSPFFIGKFLCCRGHKAKKTFILLWYEHTSYDVCYSDHISNGAAKIDFNCCLVVNKYLASEKPGVTEFFIKCYMHPDRITRLDLSFELCSLYPCKHGFPSSIFTVISRFLHHPGHEKGSCLKHSFTEQNSWHYRITWIMALKKIKIRCNEFFCNYCL